MRKRFEARMLKEKGVSSVTTWVGSGVPRFYLPLDQVFPQSNVSQAIVLPKDLVEREALRKRLPALVATEFPEVRARVKLLPNGPPVPYPVQFRIAGEDPTVVRQWADQAKEILRANANMRGVNDNWNEPVKVAEAGGRSGQGPRPGREQPEHRAGIAHPAVGQHDRPVPRGRQADRHRAAPAAGERNVITDIGNAYVPTSSGRSIPLTQIATVSFDWEPGVLWREGRNYAVTVQGDVAEGLQGATVTARGLARSCKALQAKMPVGYTIEIAGAVEESSKGQGSIAAGVPVMLFIIFTLLMLQLQSFSRARSWSS